MIHNRLSQTLHKLLDKGSNEEKLEDMMGWCFLTFQFYTYLSFLVALEDEIISCEQRLQFAKRQLHFQIMHVHYHKNRVPINLLRRIHRSTTGIKFP